MKYRNGSWICRPVNLCYRIYVMVDAFLNVYASWKLIVIQYWFSVQRWGRFHSSIKFVTSICVSKKNVILRDCLDISGMPFLIYLFLSRLAINQSKLVYDIPKCGYCEVKKIKGVT